MGEVDTETNFNLQISSENDDSDCVSRICNTGCFMKFFKYTGLLFIVCCSVALPPLMIYSGVEYAYCDNYYTKLLLVGGIFWYMELFAIALLWKIQRNITFILLIISSLALLGWWIPSLQRYYTDDEFYQSLIWEDKDCRFWVAKLSFYTVSIPLWLLIYAIFSLFISVVIPFCVFFLMVFCYGLVGKEYY